ncbi:hypothetical protein GQ457_01G020000 [Hibiscus cannabinus]
MERNENNGQHPADGQAPPAPAGGAIAPLIPQNNQQQRIRTVRDYLAEDLEGLNPAVTIPEFEVEHFELKPIMFNMLNTLGQFGGSPADNTRQHLKSFPEICNSFKIHGVSNDVLKLKLFPYPLRDKAKAWLNNLLPGSLQSWTELLRSFLSKFSYTNMTDHLRNQITSFRQEDDEAMHKAWEHYRDLFRRCLMHGLPEWTQVSIFYNSVNILTRMMLDASANGTLLDKPPRESLKILDKLAQNDYQYPTSRREITRRGPTQLDSCDTILAQISALKNMVKNMQKQPNIQEVKALDAFCELCGNNHDASECGQTIESSCYVGNYNKNTMSNTYNPAWRNHPNISWKNQNNALNPQQPNQSGFQNQPRQNPRLPSHAHCLEIFMDDFSTFGEDFNSCLSNLEKVLTRCKETNLLLNWEKCHFMVDEGIVLGHKISSRGMEVDKEKIDVISKLPPPTTVKGIRSFLGHAGFYRRFIEDFSKITKPLCSHLEQGKQFEFNDDCTKAFEI